MIFCLLKTFFGIVFWWLFWLQVQRKKLFVCFCFFWCCCWFCAHTQGCDVDVVVFCVPFFLWGCFLESSCSGEWCDVDRFDRWGRSTTIAATTIIGTTIYSGCEGRLEANSQSLMQIVVRTSKHHAFDSTLRAWLHSESATQSPGTFHFHFHCWFSQKIFPRTIHNKTTGEEHLLTWHPQQTNSPTPHDTQTQKHPTHPSPPHTPTNNISFFTEHHNTHTNIFHDSTTTTTT